MPPAFRRLLACLLLVLLPFQALAATAIGYACPGRAMAMLDCCDHDSGQPASGMHCGMALGCMSAATPAMPACAPAPLMPAQGCAASAAAVHFHDSFIPDGLERPPRPLS